MGSNLKVLDSTVEGYLGAKLKLRPTQTVRQWHQGVRLGLICSMFAIWGFS